MILCSYVLGHVQKVVQQPTYEVAFDDGSVCTNLPPGDLLVRHSQYVFQYYGR